MKICSISDLHGNLVYYPSDYWKGLWECEVLFICGDILPLEIQLDMIKSIEWLTEEFLPWAESLPVEKVFFIAGNHDFWFERNDIAAHKLFPQSQKVTYLKNELVEYISSQDSKIYKIFGSPYCKPFGLWAFMRSADILIKKFNEIPENVDILFTHDAPNLGTVGTILEENHYSTNINAGNSILSEYILKKRPRYCFCGHIHSGNHNLEKIGDSNLANCSILNEGYKIVYDPLYLRISKE